jgi:hypothetical protein
MDELFDDRGEPNARVLPDPDAVGNDHPGTSQRAVTDDTSLREVREWLMQARDDGVTCPCCTQLVKVYKRTLPSATARVMIELYRRQRGDEYVFLPRVLDGMTGTPHQGGYGTLAHFWGLLEQQPGERADGSNRVGWWRLTEKGRRFVRGEVTVPKHAHVFNGRCLGYSGPEWSIRQALGTKFDYAELMEGNAT